MKLKVLNIIVSLFVAVCTITSCLDENTEIEYSSNASITAFSITDSIITYYSSITDEGNDTILSTAVVGSQYPFVIDQLNGSIYNEDSLPVGTDISKVVVNISTDGYYVVVEAGENDSIWTSTDSLDFTKPIQFKVLSEMNTFGRIYTAKLNVHTQEPNLLAWTRLNSNFSTNIQAQKAVYANKNIYVFAEGTEQIAVTSSSNGKTWSELQPIDITEKADYSTAIAWNGQIYILANQELYTSTNGINWTKVDTEQRFSQLLANCKNKLIAADTDNYYIESEDAMTWERQEVLPADFPKNPYTFTSYELPTNPNLERIVLMGKNVNKEDTTTVVWNQLSNESEWVAMTYDFNSSLCPKFENPTIIRYNNLLYAFGGPAKIGKTINAFSKFYSSTDNGISWKVVKDKNITFPEEFESLYEQAEGNYSCFVDDKNFIWVIWSKTGEVWRGRINKFGFKKQ